MKGLAILGVFAWAVGGWAATIHVTPTGSNAQSGATWGLAKQTIGAALAIAQPGDLVFVKRGTYLERVTLPSGVALYGGFAGTESSPNQRNIAANPTVMDGQNGGRVILISGANVPSNTIVDGMTITNGSAARGAGLFFASGSPQIRQNQFVTNTATSQGGAIAFDSGSPSITINGFQGNSVNGSGTASICMGGGIGFDSGSPSIAGNVFQANTVTMSGLTSTAMGGGIGAFDLQSALIENNSFVSNVVTMTGDFSEGLGGGIGFYDGSPTMRGNLLQSNRVETASDTGQASGAGIYFYGLASSPLILSSAFLDNSCFAMGVGATAAGGAVYGYTGAATIASNLMARNACTYVGDFSGPEGGAISLYEGSHSLISNTIYGNLAEDQGAVTIWTGDAVVFNNILSNNSSGLFTGCAGAADYNLYDGNAAFDLSGTLTLGANCLQADPLFVNAPGGDFHLQAISPAVDSGDDSVIVSGWVDADGLSRIFGVRTDRGAFEFRPSPVPISGQVTLQSFVGSVPSEVVTLEFRVNGVVHETVYATLNASGQFTAMAHVRGIYTVTAKASHWLRKKIDGVNIGNSGASGLNYSLVNGDIDGNNQVDSDDFDQLVAYFGTNSSIGDLDGNGSVDSDDFDILVASFGMSGDN